MGKSKERCKKMVEVANDVQSMSAHILKEWNPSKNRGLSKKESLAAYVGFALGLYHGAESVLRGVPIHDSGDISVYDWLCMNVQQYRDDREGYVSDWHGSCDCGVWDDDDVESLEDTLALITFLEMLSGRGDDEEE